MNSLEFLETQIDYFEKDIQFFENLLKRRTNPLLPREKDDEKFDLLTIKGIKLKMKNSQDILNFCYQIKTEIEAWEVVKEKIKFEDLGEMQNGNIYRGYFEDCLDESEFYKLKKALEVKDER